jgi:hypothetical protein
VGDKKGLTFRVPAENRTEHLVNIDEHYDSQVSAVKWIKPCLKAVSLSKPVLLLPPTGVNGGEVFPVRYELNM